MKLPIALASCLQWFVAQTPVSVSSLPQYPETRPIELSDQSLIHRAAAITQPIHSIYQFANLWSFYHSRFKVSLSHWREAVLIRIQPDGGEPILLQPLNVGTPRSGEIIKELLDNFPTPFEGIPPTILPHLALDRKRYEVVEDEGWANYVYETASLAKLEGQAYRKQRQQVRRFLEEYGARYRYVSIAHHPEILPSLLELTQKWLQNKTFEDPKLRLEAEYESHSITRFVRHFSEFGLLGGALLVDGAVVAFCLAAPRDENLVTVFAEKADYQFEGSAKAINQFFAQEMLERGFSFINREQDGDILGLRQAKRAYHPVKMLKWFRLKTARRTQ